MRIIKTQSTLIKVLKEEGNKLFITKELYDLSIAYVIDSNDKKIYEVISYAYMPLIGIENKRQLWYGNELKLELNGLTNYVKQLLKKEQKKERKETKKEAYEALEYFKGWQEGDTITITVDFLKNVEAIAEYLESLKK